MLYEMLDKHRNQLSNLSIKFCLSQTHENKQNQIQKLIAQRGSFTFTTTPPKLAFVLKTTPHILAIIIGLVLKILNLIDLDAKDHVKRILNANIGHLVSLQLLARKDCVIWKPNEKIWNSIWLIMFLEQNTAVYRNGKVR